MLRVSCLLSIVAATLLLLGSTTASVVFKRIETSCKQNNVECLGADTYTYCLNRGVGSYLLKFVFNCPKNYVCDEAAKNPCVKEDTASLSTPSTNQITSPESDLPPKTDHESLDKIIEDFIASLPDETNALEFENDVFGRAPSSEISSDNDIIISPTTEVNDDDSVIITPTDSSSSSPGGSVIITPDSTSSPSDSVIITPAPGGSPPDGVIITPDNPTSAPPTSPGGGGSVIITPEATAAPPGGSIIVPPGSTSPPGSIIITGNSVLTGPVYFVHVNQESRIDPEAVETVEEVEPEIERAGIIITPGTTTTPSPGGGGGGGVIITPDPTTTPAPGGVIITPQPPGGGGGGGGGGIIITPNTTTEIGIINPTDPGNIGNPPNCTTTGSYPGPTCDQYYQCILVWWWYEYRLNTCATGLYFSYSQQGCVILSQSDC